MKRYYFAFISMIVLLSWTNIPETFAQGATVYMCTGKYSVKYHKNKNCGGLANCTGDIVATSVSAARKAGKEECQKCFVNSSAPAAKDVKKSTTSTAVKKVTPKKEAVEKKVATTTKKEVKKDTSEPKKAGPAVKKVTEKKPATAKRM